MRTIAIFLLLLAALSAAAAPVLQTNGTYQVSNPAQAVTLAWDPSPDPAVVTYNLYYGAAGAGLYTNVLMGLTATSANVSNLQYGATYHFAATCNTATLESVFSAEATYATPSLPAATTLHPPQKLVVQVKHSLTGQWADSGMFWSIDPGETNAFYRLTLAAAGPTAPQLLRVKTAPALPQRLKPIPAELDPTRL